MKRKLASFDVDAQKGFTPICPEELPVPDGDLIVNALEEMASVASIRIGSKDAHPANPVWLAGDDREILAPLNYPNANMAWPSHCVTGTRGFDLLDGLPRPEEYDFFVWKGVERDLHPYGACYHDLKERLSTGATEFLKARGVTDVVVGGLAYEHCVFSTVRQLCRAGFKVAIYEPATRGLDDAEVNGARKEMIALGVKILRSSQDLVDLYAKLSIDDRGDT